MTCQDDNADGYNNKINGDTSGVGRARHFCLRNTINLRSVWEVLFDCTPATHVYLSTSEILRWKMTE